LDAGLVAGDPSKPERVRAVPASHPRAAGPGARFSRRFEPP